MAKQHIHKPSVLKANDVFSSLDKIHQSIRERAYQLFHDRDRNSGDEVSDWLKAESEILTDINLTMKDNGNEVVVEGSVDEFLPEDIEVKAQDGKLTICGIHTEESSNEEAGVSSKTKTQSNFYRSFTLPDSVDADKLKVEMKKGKFVAKIPKAVH
jgi:HSP20 family protein